MTQTDKIISAYESSYMYLHYYNMVIKYHKDELDEGLFEEFLNKAAIHEHTCHVLIGLLSADLMRKRIPEAKKWAIGTANDMYKTWLKYR